MQRQLLVITAARVAKTFDMDPLAVLDADRFEWDVRLAAARVIAQDEKDAASKTDG